ncbi:MAG: hypothetical protein IBJ10_09070 [Phycisphaerales bacterium]|nr:hypothetical protein [Phycisphaerales bacterium]
MALLSLISGHARADIWVEYYNISDVLRTRTFHAPGAPIQLSLASTDFYVRVFSLPPANDSIGLITSGGSGSQVVSLFVARSITFDTVFQTLSGGMHWAGLNDVQNRIRLRSYVTGNLTGDVTAREIVTLRVGGAIQANVSTTIASPAPFFIRAEAGTASGSALSSAASVGLIQIPNGGNLFSNVHAATYIGQIAVTGNIGSPSAPVAISAGSPNVGNNFLRSSRQTSMPPSARAHPPRRTSLSERSTSTRTSAPTAFSRCYHSASLK